MFFACLLLFLCHCYAKTMWGAKRKKHEDSSQLKRSDLREKFIINDAPTRSPQSKFQSPASKEIVDLFNSKMREMGDLKKLYFGFIDNFREFVSSDDFLEMVRSMWSTLSLVYASLIVVIY